MFTAGETVTVIRPAQRDRTGDRTGDGVPHTIDNCGIAPDSRSSGRFASTSITDHREAAVTTVELICPPGADIRFGDRVQLPHDDATYAVDGLTWMPHNPFTGWEPGVMVRLRGVEDA